MRPTSYHKYTTDDLKYIEEHCCDNPADVAAALNAPFNTVERYMSNYRKQKSYPRQFHPRYYYALYLRKTDELVCSGTAKECAEKLGVSIHTIYSVASRSRRNEIQKYDIYIEPYEDVYE